MARLKFSISLENFKILKFVNLAWALRGQLHGSDGAWPLELLQFQMLPVLQSEGSGTGPENEKFQKHHGGQNYYTPADNHWGIFFWGGGGFQVILTRPITRENSWGIIFRPFQAIGILLQESMFLLPERFPKFKSYLGRNFSGKRASGNIFGYLLPPGQNRTGKRASGNFFGYLLHPGPGKRASGNIFGCLVPAGQNRTGHVHPKPLGRVPRQKNTA